MKLPKFLIPNKWETIYSCKASAHKGNMFGQSARVPVLMKVQVENLKNKFRCILSDGADTNPIELDYVLATMPRDESMKLRLILMKNGIQI